LKITVSPKYQDFLSHWFPLVLYCLLIFVQSSRPSPEQLPEFLFMDKLLHFGGYALLGILFFRAFRTLRIKDRTHFLFGLSILAATLFGIGDEIHQYFVPFRNADILDATADFLGSTCGVYLYQRWLRRKESRQEIRSKS
jgi:VanZ family protein